MQAFYVNPLMLLCFVAIIQGALVPIVICEFSNVVLQSRLFKLHATKGQLVLSLREKN